LLGRAPTKSFSITLWLLLQRCHLPLLESASHKLTDF
jgi:hypothetical protein